MKSIIVNKLLLLPLLFAGIQPELCGQNLDSLLNEKMGQEETTYPAIFRSATLINSHSVYMLPAGTLDFRVEHRFGTLNQGAYEFWGLDYANIHLSLEYAVTDWLMAGIGRGTYEKTYDGFIRINTFKQASGSDPFPLSIALQSGLYINTLRYLKDFDDYRFAQRLEHVHQVLIARRFFNMISLQIAPSYLRRTPISSVLEQTDLFAMGTGVGVKITSNVSLNIEYFRLLNYKPQLKHRRSAHPLSIGFDLETGGHVFQLIFTNSLAMTEQGIIGGTTGRWLDGDIHFGFNISRVFSIR